MTLYAVTIFLSAFLLFQVQPLIAKMILPWFGGSAAVWSASMLFFQLLLLAGYAYAHVSIRFLKPRMQMLVHVLLLLGSCALLPILPNPVWRPTQPGDPTARILLLLTATIGLPYFLLSSTSPLLQAWFVRRTGSGVPYRLFALSNFGSMLALVSFPFLVEPTLATRQQAFWWSGGYVVFALMCAFTAWVSRSAGADHPNQVVPQPESVERPSFWQLVFWVLLAGCASVLLVSVTNHMSQNVAPIPLLWVLPLALYLLTFICAFESDRVYRRWLFIPLLAPALAGMAYMIYAEDGNFNIKYAIPGFAVGLFVCCLFCHGELARRRPAPRHLTLFYLMVSIGGALGGIFVALIAPRVFRIYWELPLGLIACGILAMIAVWSLRLPKLGAWPVRAFILIAVAVLAGYFIRQERRLSKHLVLQARNFYGPLEVRDDLPTEDYAQRTLLHGTIDHGSQLLDPVLRYVTTSYYAKRSGVGRAMSELQAKGPVRAGVIGLGAGVLSNYGRKGDYFRIYEINPLVQRIAQTLFTFYPHSAADKAILMGDARLTLERQLANEGPQNYDILAVDAFSSDAIPVHLLTREAIQLYFRHLKPDGVLALHISNRYLDLKPVCEGGAASVGRQAWVVEDEGDEANYLSASTWVLVTSDLSLYKGKFFKDATISQYTAKKSFRPWTDDYSNLFQILDVK
jgi:SAM-dependent methyltransferase